MRHAHVSTINDTSWRDSGKAFVWVKRIWLVDPEIEVVAQGFHDRLRCQFRRGSDFVRAADAMITKNLRVNGEFYVAPVYNEMIMSGARLAMFNIGRECGGMYGIGTPADLKHFLTLSISRRAAAL